MDSEKQYLCKVRVRWWPCLCWLWEGRSINRRSLDDDRNEERVNSGLIGVVAIPGISWYSNTLEPARVGQGNSGRQAY